MSVMLNISISQLQHLWGSQEARDPVGPTPSILHCEISIFIIRSTWLRIFSNFLYVHSLFTLFIILVLLICWFPMICWLSLPKLLGAHQGRPRLAFLDPPPPSGTKGKRARNETQGILSMAGEVLDTLPSCMVFNRRTFLATGRHDDQEHWGPRSILNLLEDCFPFCPLSK